MNIIISKDERVKSVVLDLRDIMYGTEAEIVLDDCIAIVDKRYFVKTGDLANYENIIDYLTVINKKILRDKILLILEKEIRKRTIKSANQIAYPATRVKMTMADLNRLRDRFMFSEIKCLTIEERQGRIIVSKPLWENSVSLISVGVDRETSTFEIRREGVSCVETLDDYYQNDYAEGAGVAYMIMSNSVKI